MSGCDKEDSSVFGFEGMGVNAKALTPVNAKAFREHSKEKCIVYRGVEILYKCSQKIILDSSMVEHSAVNRVVVGSSPTRGAV